MKPEPKLRARRMWTNYSSFKTGFYVSLHRTRARALVGAMGWDAMKPIPVAVIPLDDIDGMIIKAAGAYWRGEQGMTRGDAMRDALSAIGIPCKRKASK